ncbi:MAG: 2-oxoacid:acceptor oxidoreductase family protein [Oscillospiraceae bacterium]|nr:2-oxoacid:acceptor oxidoreductase family protein [Oscillospiraceae bacterium]
MLYIKSCNRVNYKLGSIDDGLEGRIICDLTELKRIIKGRYVDMRYEIRYGALGGQGIVTAGNLLLEIAVKHENKHASASPTYTATVRGGPTKVDVILSDEIVLFPHATAIDFCIFTDQRPFNLYKSRLKNDAILVVDSNLVTDLGDTLEWTVYPMPIISETEKTLGFVALTSVVSLSMTQLLTNIIHYSNMESFVRGWAPKQFLDLNMKAIELGRTMLENCTPIKKPALV